VSRAEAVLHAVGQRVPKRCMPRRVAYAVPCRAQSQACATCRRATRTTFAVPSTQSMAKMGRAPQASYPVSCTRPSGHAADSSPTRPRLVPTAMVPREKPPPARMGRLSRGGGGGRPMKQVRATAIHVAAGECAHRAQPADGSQARTSVVVIVNQSTAPHVGGWAVLCFATPVDRWAVSVPWGLLFWFLCCCCCCSC